VSGQDSREEHFKQQAQRLREFLAVAGIELKHKNSLEAVARMHGAKDWHSLIAGAAAEGAEDAGVRGSASSQFAIVTHYNGYASVCVAPSRELALRDFLQEARMLIDVFGAAEARFVGQDMDSSLPLLSLMLDGSVIASLQHPSIVDGMNVSVAKGGAARMEPAKPVNLLGLDEAQSFFSIAVALGEAFASRKESEEKPRHQAARDSLPAHLMGIDFDEALVALAVETQRAEEPEPLRVDPRDLLRAIDRIKLMHSVVARVSADGVRLGLR
jgi:hypothetical protein